MSSMTAIPQDVVLTRLGKQAPELGATRPKEPNTVLLLHGPSSNMFGERDPKHYGTMTLADIEKFATKEGEKVGLKVVCAQSNYEGDIVEHLHAARTYGAVVMNPNAFVHYSYALRDAIEAIQTPVIEIHLSNLYKRAMTEPHRAANVTAAASAGYICGCGLFGYALAIQRCKMLIEERKEQQQQ